jgi:hypothetical protein
MRGWVLLWYARLGTAINVRSRCTTAHFAQKSWNKNFLIAISNSNGKFKIWTLQNYQILKLQYFKGFSRKNYYFREVLTLNTITIVISGMISIWLLDKPIARRVFKKLPLFLSNHILTKEHHVIKRYPEAFALK